MNSTRYPDRGFFHAPVLYPNCNAYDNGTRRWIYFTYEPSTREIDITPEFPSFLILSLLMTTTLPIAIAYKRKRFVLE